MCRPTPTAFDYKTSFCDYDDIRYFGGRVTQRTRKSVEFIRGG